MAILKVAQIGHPLLRMKAAPVDVETIPTPGFQQFCDDLLETMYEYDGAGLAAPQVYTSIRVVVLTLDDQRGPEFLVNPEITVLSDETRRSYEGCLSIEGIRAAVERPSHIHVRALDRTGTPKEYELRGFPATVVQHECDHLDGVLFVDRMDTTTMAFLPEYRRFGPLDEWDLEQGERRDSDDEDDLEELEVLE